MKILVINSGSSSIKYKLYDMQSRVVLTKGLIEEIKNKRHEVLEGIIKDLGKIDVIAHRVVHGGEKFSKATLIDEKVIEQIESLCALAPLHNPANLDGILTAKAILPECVQIAVFDTAFHQSMPKSSYMYALPQEICKQHHIRRYGFHGTSHHFLLKECAKILNKNIDELNLITLHLGNGASATAIKNGRSFETSMGFTPLEGLVMGTRSGDFDPAIILYLQTLGMSAKEVDTLVNKKSGLLGICAESDLRAIIARDDEDAKDALLLMTQRIKKYIGAYIALLGRVDAIVFSGGIGEHSLHVRKMSLEGLDEAFGILLDEAHNKIATDKAELISKPESKIAVYEIPTDEELEIATQAMELIHLES